MVTLHRTAVDSQLSAFCWVNRLTVEEFQFLNCCWNGQKTDSEIRDNLYLTNEKLHAVIQRLVSKELIQRSGTGLLEPTLQGKNLYQKIADMITPALGYGA